MNAPGEPITPEILIERLAWVAGAFGAGALAVQFENDVRFVGASEADQVVKLRRLIETGGQPIGFLFARQEGRQVQIAAVPLAELEDEPGIHNDLLTVLHHFRALLVKDGKVAPAAAQ